MNSTERRKDRRRHEKLLNEIQRLKSWNAQMQQKLDEYEARVREKSVPWWEKLRKAIGTEVLNG